MITYMLSWLHIHVTMVTYMLSWLHIHVVIVTYPRCHGYSRCHGYISTLSWLQDGHQYGDEYLAELDHIEVIAGLKEGYEDDVVDPLEEGEEDSDKSDDR